MKKTNSYNSKLELLRFLAYTFTAIMVMLIISEAVLLMYWHLHFGLDKASVANQTLAGYQAAKENTVQDYEANVKVIVAQLRQGAGKDMDHYKDVKNKLLSLLVPPARQQFHLQLVVLLDEIMSSLNKIEKDRSREAQMLFDAKRQELEALLDNNQWLQE